MTKPLKAFCDRDKWNNFPRAQKILAVQEEAMVIALERILVPDRVENNITQIPPGLSEDEVFLWAVMRICTTLTSGWFRKFAVDNYEQVIQTYNHDYWNLFLSKQNQLKPRR